MIASDQQYTITAAETVAVCLVQMAELETNPVLLITPSAMPFEENKKYPEQLLQFNQLGWRAYYHCHPASRAGNHRFKGEHGHFHIFVQLENDPEKWSHLAALAIDNMGQPLGWFTVNHWVTGETWATADVLLTFLDDIPFEKLIQQQSEMANTLEPGLNLVECWILSLLALSRDKVKVILHQRDEILSQEQDKQEQDIKQNKGIYLLSEIPIDLLSLLSDIKE